MVDVSQKICMSLKGITPAIEGIACNVATKDKAKQKDCAEVFKNINLAAKASCDISLDLLCDAETCPQNVNKRTCRKLAEASDL